MGKHIPVFMVCQMRSELPLRLSRRLSWSRSNRLEGPGVDSPRHCVAGSCWCAAASDRNSTLASSSVTNASRSRSSSRSNTKEALYVAVLPRRTRLDEQSLHTNSRQPLPDALGRELSRESLRVSMLTQHLACGRSRQCSCDHAVTRSRSHGQEQLLSAQLRVAAMNRLEKLATHPFGIPMRPPARDWHRLLKQSVPVPVLCLLFCASVMCLLSCLFCPASCVHKGKDGTGTCAPAYWRAPTHGA